MKLLILVLAVAGAFANAQPANSAKDMYELGELNEAQIRENAKTFQINELSTNAIAAYRLASGIPRETKLEWEQVENTPANIRAAASETKVAYFINDKQDSCKLTLRRWDLISQTCNLAVFCFSPAAPYAANDTYASSNREGRIVQVTGSCRDHRHGQMYPAGNESKQSAYKRAEFLSLPEIQTYFEKGVLN